MRQGLVCLSQSDADAPDLPAVGSVSKEGGDDGGFAIGVVGAASGATWVDRPYFTGRPDPGWLAGKVNQSLDAGAIVQVGNEQNHPDEGWPGGPADWLAYWSEVVRLTTAPDRCLAMPPSPGFPDWQEWVGPSGPCAVHAYGTAAQMVDILSWYLANTPGDLYVTEFNFGAGQSVDLDAWVANEMAPFLDWCALQPRIKTCLYFAYKWDRSPTLPTSVDAAGTSVERLLTTWQPPNGGANGGTTVPDWYAAAVRCPIGVNYTPGRAGVVRAVVEHIAQGLGSPFGWFNTDRGQDGSSAHFWVARSGLVEQYRPLGDTCWANGPICSPDTANPAVAQIIATGGDPNAQTVAIEHEGYSGDPLTGPQIAASHDLTAWLCAQYGLTVGRDDVIGHYQLDSCNRPFCPGPAYPWSQIVGGGSAPVPPAGFSIDALRDQVWKLAEQAEANGWPWYSQGLKAATTLSKGEH